METNEYTSASAEVSGKSGGASTVGASAISADFSSQSSLQGSMRSNEAGHLAGLGDAFCASSQAAESARPSLTLSTSSLGCSKIVASRSATSCALSVSQTDTSRVASMACATA